MKDENTWVDVKPKNEEDSDIIGRYNTFSRKPAMLVAYLNTRTHKHIYILNYIYLIY